MGGMAGQRLGKRNIAFLDMIERNLVSVAVSQDDNTEESERGVRAIRSAFTGVYVANGAYNRDSAIAAIESGIGICALSGMHPLSLPPGNPPPYSRQRSKAADFPYNPRRLP